MTTRESSIFNLNSKPKAIT